MEGDWLLGRSSMALLTHCTVRRQRWTTNNKNMRACNAPLSWQEKTLKFVASKSEKLGGFIRIFPMNSLNIT